MKLNFFLKKCLFTFKSYTISKFKTIAYMKVQWMKMLSISSTDTEIIENRKIFSYFYIHILFFSRSLADKIESIMLYIRFLKILYVCHVIYSISYTYYMFLEAMILFLFSILFIYKSNTLFGYILYLLYIYPYLQEWYMFVMLYVCIQIIKVHFGPIFVSLTTLN